MAEVPVTSRQPRRGVWLVATVLTVIGGALLPLLWNSRYYFADDTQSGAFGIWYELGTRLHEGVVPIFSVSSWMSGNYTAEGQWGLFNPLVLAIGWFASGVDDANLFSAGVKIFFLAIAAAGVYLLCRSYGASRLVSYAAGIAAPLAGFTLYMDAATWVTGLMVWALLPWAILGVRRMSHLGKSPWLALVASYLIVTVGYVHGTIILAVVLGLEILAHLISKNRAGALRVLLVGIFAGLIAIAVYLPGVLSADVTVRNSNDIFNDGFMTVDLSGMAGSSVATALPQINFWWGSIAPAPVLYISWLLPLLAFVQWSKVRTMWRELFVLIGLLVFAAGMMLAPSNMGPLRFPARMTPYFALAVIVLLAIALTRARVPTLSRGHVATALVLLGFGAFLGFAQTPQYWVLLGEAVVLTLIGFALLWRFSLRAQTPARAWSSTVAAGVTIGCVTLGLVAVQHRAFPSSPIGEFWLPAKVAEYQPQLSTAVNDVLVVGTPTETSVDIPREDLWSQTLLANMWYLNGHSVQNTYTPLSYETYASRMCMNWRGETCADLAERLFEKDGETGMTLADKLSIDTIQIVKTVVPEALWETPPPGWSVTSDEEFQVTWVRDEPVGPAGGVVWSSAGVETTEGLRTDRELRLTLDEVPEQGGTLVLSRLAWPGYAVENGTIADPHEEFLLTIDVSKADVGEELVVKFSPPGWTVELACLFAALLGGLVWVVLDPYLRRRRAVTGTGRGPVVDGSGAKNVPEPGNGPDRTGAVL